jgi:hypothetical protein
MVMGFSKKIVKFTLFIYALVFATYVADTLLRSDPLDVFASPGNVVINELELNPAGTDTGNEWVELYNPTSSSVSLLGWSLSTTHGDTVTVTLSGSIPPGGYLVVTYMKQWLDNEDEIVVLKSGGTIIDQTPQLDDTSNDGKSWQRYPNGATTWSFRSNTKGGPNGGEPIPELGFALATILTMVLLSKK